MSLASKELARIEALYESARDLRDLHARITRQIDAVRELATERRGLTRDDTPDLDAPVTVNWTPGQGGTVLHDLSLTFDGRNQTLEELVREVRLLRARGN